MNIPAQEKSNYLDDHQICLTSPDHLHLLLHLPPFPGGHTGVGTKVRLLQVRDCEQSLYPASIRNCLKMLVLLVAQWPPRSVPGKTHVELLCVQAANQFNLSSFLPCDRAREREGWGGSDGDGGLGRHHLLPSSSCCSAVVDTHRGVGESEVEERTVAH